jgi:hypothetical protein
MKSLEMKITIKRATTGVEELVEGVNAFNIAIFHF